MELDTKFKEQEEFVRGNIVCKDKKNIDIAFVPNINGKFSISINSKPLKIKIIK